jgi:CheY-like chemotaxis protein
LFRALGIEVVTADSSRLAEETLVRDNDFDLIISDVQRKGDSWKFVAKQLKMNRGASSREVHEIHEGTNFIVKLRNKEYAEARFGTGSVIRAIPVVFYAAYSWDKLTEFTRLARETYPEPELCNDIAMLATKALKTLSVVRSNPIVVESTKVPTWPAR